MNRSEILATAHEMRGEYARKQKDALMRVGRAVIEEESSKSYIQAYHEAQAKVLVLDELLEKITKTPEDADNPKSNPLCNDVIRDAEGNEIAIAKGVQW